MALAATTLWELQQTATAGNVNGGGFNPSNTGNGGTHGTDYTINAGAYTFADLATTNGTNATPSVTSSGHVFTGADCGNLLHINTTGTGGHFLTGWYEIVSISGSAAVLDRACSSTASETAGTYHVGGALSDGSIAPLAAAGAVAGNTVWVKTGTFTVSGATNWNWSAQLTGTTSLQCFVNGYQTNRGDNPTGSNRPQINFGTGVFLTGSFVTWQNMSFKSAHNTTTEGTAFWSGGTGTAYNCKFINTTTTANVPAIGNSTNVQCVGCEFVSYAGHAVNYSGYCAFLNCWFHDSIHGIFNNAITLANLNIMGCTFSNCTTAAFHAVSGSTWDTCIVNNCTFFGGITTPIGIGINLLGSTDQHVTAYNSIFYGLVTGYLSAQTGGGNYDNYNNYFNNTGDVSGITKGAQSIALNPQFTSVGQYTNIGTVTSSGSILVDTGANFANVVDGRDYLYVISGSGVTLGIYGITGHSSTTITTDNALGTGSAITYSIVYGQNFGVGVNMAGAGSPNTGNPSTTTSNDLGASQRSENSSDPGIANVRNGVSYTINGASLTGNVDVPSVGNVKIGVTFDTLDTLTGTYTGSDRWTDPGNTNVRSGTTYKANSLTNNETGTVVLPSAANVLSGIVYDNGTTGTLTVPTAAQNASAVWEEPTSSHTTSGSFGVLMKNLLTLAQFLGLK